MKIKNNIECKDVQDPIFFWGSQRPFLSKKRDLKGISMPLNAIVIVAIAVLVIASVGFFFLSSTFGGISDTEAQRVFAGGCARYCKPDLYETFKSAYLASQNDPTFVAACAKLQYGDEQHVNRCLEKCTNCNLKVTPEDINNGLDNLNAETTR